MLYEAELNEVQNLGWLRVLIRSLQPRNTIISSTLTNITTKEDPG